MPVPLKPASAQETAARRKSLFLAYEEKVFEQIRRRKLPVNLRGPLSTRSEILLGLKRSDETVAEAQDRIIQQFLDKHPEISEADGLVTS